MKYISLLLFCLITIIACQKDPIVDPSIYACELSFADESAAHPKKEKFEAALKKVNTIVPGTQIAVRSKDGNVWLGVQGFADIPNKAPLEKCTKTMVGSVSKIYTAVGIMQLVDAKILTINDPIRNWLDENMINQIENANEATIKHLLNHTSGIRDYLEIEHHFNSVNIPYHILSPEEKIEIIYGKTSIFPIGEEYNYSNSNYLLLGLILERASGMTFDQYIAENISAPLALENTVAGTPENPIPDDCARNYLAINNGRYIDVMPFAVADAATGDGAMATNMQDALVFIESIFDYTLVSEESLTTMLSNPINIGYETLWGKKNFYGLGLEITNDNKYGLLLGHSGSTAAYWSELLHFPDTGVTVAVGFNADTEDDASYGKLLDLILEVVDIAFE